MYIAADWLKFVLFGIVLVTFPENDLLAQEQRPEIPEALQPWQDWSTWGDKDRECPAVFNNAKDRICFWPSQLSLTVDKQRGSWRIVVSSFADTWMPLPGNAEVWPQNVIGNGKPVVVIERNGRPTVRLAKGRYELSGEFSWQQMPQKISIPKEIGIISLNVDGNNIPVPSWDAAGDVWLKRTRTEEAERNLISAQVYRVIEDGIPLWLRTEIELTISGNSREEELGWSLPQGWKLATVESPLPVAIDEQGRTKAQVRAGKWNISLHAFRTVDAGEIGFADNAQPITDVEWIGFRAQPEFRLAELADLKAVDVTQTTFPKKWRNLPVFQWETGQPFRLIEKLRGMGLQRPEGLKINRRFWFDENGKSLTFRDDISGQMQQIWRLDAAQNHDLGAVRVDGEGQLITTNPISGVDGVEIRTRDLNLQAIGRVNDTQTIDAIGWQTDVDSLSVLLDLPPGWRMLALFGADKVDGDWLTAWTLLDLFLLLIFSLGVARIFGIPAGIIAFLAFGLAFHEPGSPRLTWFFLLIPVALLSVVKSPTANKWLNVWKYLAVALLAIYLVPFVGNQIQSALYPQLEISGVNYRPRQIFQPLSRNYVATAGIDENVAQRSDLMLPDAEILRGGGGREPQLEELAQQDQLGAKFKSSNLLYDPKARIQTGPAEPEWSWNRVRCYWDGPVTTQQQIRPVLLSLNQHRVVSVVRIVLLVLLAGILVGFKLLPSLLFRRRAAAAAGAVLICFSPATLTAQEIPNQEMLKQLRQRLLAPNDAFPQAAEIAKAALTLKENRITIDVEIHAAMQVAVPLPGKLPDWSPVSVTVDSKASDLICRRDGYLWVVLPGGVHDVVVEAVLPEVSEWEWTFILPPRNVTIDAPGWNVTGLRPNGIPERQIFFVRQDQPVEGEAAYDRTDFNAIVVVDRHLETGLIWQVRNEVTRLSRIGKAVSIRVPLLEGERVLSSNVVVEDGQIEVKLGAEQQTFSWNSQLPIGQQVNLTAPQTDTWVERWHLVASPVWNVTRAGLAPVFESQQQNLIPVWHPWPGENVSLTFNKPVAVEGETVTVRRVQHEIALGRRQRSTELQLELECSLGNDFNIDLNPDAEISSVKVNGRSIPVRRDGASLIVAVQPGKQKLEAIWRTDQTMKTAITIDPVSLPVDSANITTIVTVPESRWVLWTDGPTRGPAVRFWVILLLAIVVALLLGGIKFSPLARIEWLLLAIGLTQIHVAAAGIVVVWLFVLAWRGRADMTTMRWWLFNLQQIGLVLLTFIALAILIAVVGSGLLGHPDMFIIGNGSSRTYLNWFQPRGGTTLPETKIVSISVWFYRLAMLFWALWLAAALLRWLGFGWKQFNHGGAWKSRPKIETPSAELVDAELS